MVVQARVQAPMAAVKCAWPVQSRPAKGAFQAMALNGRVHDATNAKSRRRIAASAVETVTMTAELPTSSVKTTASSFPPPLPKLDDSYERIATFAPFANWIIPGHVLLGRYPYVEPSRCRTRDEGDAQIEAIIKAGITTFVCLQEEIPPQGEIRLAGVDGFLPYRGSAQIIASSQSEPPSIEEVSALRTPELDRFLPPRRRPAKYPLRHRIQVEFLHCPIVDLGIPEEKQLAELLNELTARLERGEKLYIHCWGGRGRAGTVGSTLLAKLYGIDAEEALERVQRAFDTRQDEQRRSPETPEQHKFVQEFINGRKYEA